MGVIRVAESRKSVGTLPGRRVERRGAGRAEGLEVHSLSDFEAELGGELRGWVAHDCESRKRQESFSVVS